MNKDQMLFELLLRHVIGQ